MLLFLGTKYFNSCCVNEKIHVYTIAVTSLSTRVIFTVSMLHTLTQPRSVESVMKQDWRQETEGCRYSIAVMFSHALSTVLQFIYILPYYKLFSTVKWADFGFRKMVIPRLICTVYTHKTLSDARSSISKTIN